MGVMIDGVVGTTGAIRAIRVTALNIPLIT